MRPEPGLTLRPAGPADAPALTALERAAGLAALAHLFPPAQHPYPTSQVLDRWRESLRDPAVHTLVHEESGVLVGLVAHDDDTVRHLAVHPDRWGGGTGRALLDGAVAAIRAGARTPRLWCLVGNERARGLYAHRGWSPTGRSRPTSWPPHPSEVELVLRGDRW